MQGYEALLGLGITRTRNQTVDANPARNTAHRAPIFFHEGLSEPPGLRSSFSVSVFSIVEQF
jgi:hypothetical protein